MKIGNIIIGNDTDNIFTDKVGRLHFAGDSRPKTDTTFSATDCKSYTNDKLELTALAASNGISTSGLDQATANGKQIEVIGIDGGISIKGFLNSSYTQKNTTAVSTTIKIRLTTMHALNTWVQTSDWLLILDILTGPITGKFTIFMPPFDLLEYSTIELFVTQDGATYNHQNSLGMDRSLGGPTAAEESFSNNESAGSDVVVEVASTTGFYEGNEVFISDSANSEWSRITDIVTDTSITVDTLINSYTTANGAKFEQIDYIKTVETRPLQRGLTITKIFKAGENSGISFNYAIPIMVDPTSDILILLTYIYSEANPSANVAKFRTQYVIYGVGDDIPISKQYGTFVYANITPPATKYQIFELLGVIPAAAHAGKQTCGIQIARLGAPGNGDTYTGNIKLAGVVMQEITNKLGYEA